MNKEIVINSNYNQKLYSKALLMAILPKKRFWFVAIVYSILIINGLIFFIKEILSDNFNLNNLLKPEFFVMFLPFAFFLVIKKAINSQFKNNFKLKEDIYHYLNNDFYLVKGETFETKYLWEDLIKIIEEKEYFLVFINKINFFMIVKANLKANQYNELKELFNSIDIKKSLK